MDFASGIDFNSGGNSKIILEIKYIINNILLIKKYHRLNCCLCLIHTIVNLPCLSSFYDAITLELDIAKSFERVENDTEE